MAVFGCVAPMESGVRGASEELGVGRWRVAGREVEKAPAATGRQVWAGVVRVAVEVVRSGRGVMKAIVDVDVDVEVDLTVGRLKRWAVLINEADRAIVRSGKRNTLTIENLGDTNVKLDGPIGKLIDENLLDIWRQDHHILDNTWTRTDSALVFFMEIL